MAGERREVEAGAAGPRSAVIEAPARLEVENLTAGYNGRNALVGVSFQVPHGSQVAVVGPNGAGKSTLFKVLVGLLPARSGRILIHGRPGSELRARGNHKECVAYVPQREEVDWRFPVTAADVVMMGRFGRQGWLQRPGKHDREVVLQSLEAMGIASLANRPIGELSGGQQQRVFLARALAQEPHILLMDEPFTGVDVATLEATLGLLEDLRGRAVTVIVSTHDLTLAAQRFDSVMLINRRLIAHGPPEQVFTSHHLQEAFGGKALFVEGAIVFDECCQPGEEDR